ncbi:type II secretion system protein GspM [Sessilibacter sp. MAH2]
MNAINEYWATLSRRDQAALFICSVAIGLAIIWWLLLEPSANTLANQKLSTQSTSESLARVREMALELKEYQTGGGPKVSSAPLSELIDRSLRLRGLRMSSFQPVREGEVRLRLEEAEYGKVIEWLYQMEYEEGLQAKELTVTPTRTSGRVSVSIRLAR